MVQRYNFKQGDKAWVNLTHLHGIENAEKVLVEIICPTTVEQPIVGVTWVVRAKIVNSEFYPFDSFAVSEIHLKPCE